MNRLLKRQLKKHLGDLLTKEDSFQSESFQSLLNAINKSYDFKDKELRLFERTIDLNSQELNDANSLLKKQNEEITELATIDSLTGLSNRYAYNSKIDHAIKRAKRHNRNFALMFLDLDRFKIINDSLGHQIGDLLLQHVAMRIIHCVRSTDTVARLGGDEFTILLDEINDISDTSIVAKKILNKLSEPFHLEGHELSITASIGISTYPIDGSSLVELAKNADAAMYQAKESGRNNFQIYDPMMGEKAVENMALEASLRRALAEHEFVLYYQPQLDLATGKICGVEALIRWNSPKFGLVMPGDFIPMAEDTGLILPIGEWVLQNACFHNKAWQQSGLPKVRVAVNVSLRQLLNPNFLPSVDSALCSSNLDPKYLEIELTESSVMQKSNFSLDILRELKSRGIYLSIDDFGTGYSSLSHLKQFPINKLKIDRSFVIDIKENADANAIIEAIIAMSHSLKLDVIAEGVETADQLNLLREKNCDQIQGYYLSRPKPVPKIAQMLKEDRSYFENHLSPLR